jgi:hypothetical protein
LKVGAPFNPYRVFQGSFAPYWLLEHRGVSAGAKLCYIRLLGFAGKDARCYPSLEKLGTSLGVSERQARDYVKELERIGFIVVEQRGLRKTNAYLFVWTAELERLANAVPESGEDPDEPGGGGSQDSRPDRNDCSGPIGINSPGISSLESSSSSAEEVANYPRKTTTPGGLQESPEAADQRTKTISRWARERGIQRLRMDRRVGAPDEEHLRQWSGILERWDVAEPETIFALLDWARAAADRSGEWRNWSFLTLQIQLAAERRPLGENRPEASLPEHTLIEENPASDWAVAKEKIRTQLGEIPFRNWFAQTRQVGRQGAQITLAVSDEASRFFLEAEYGDLTRGVLAELGIHEIQWTPQSQAANDEVVQQIVAKHAPCPYRAG